MLISGYAGYSSTKTTIAIDILHDMCIILID